MPHDEKLLRTFCAACRTLLAEVGNSADLEEPCPKCGSTGHALYPPGKEFVLTGGLVVKSVPPGGGRWGCKSEVKHSYFAREGREHHIHRIIDRWGNRYYERIIDVETGEVVRLVDEPLTHHTGRGSASKSYEEDSKDD